MAAETGHESSGERVLVTCDAREPELAEGGGRAAIATAPGHVRGPGLVAVRPSQERRATARDGADRATADEPRLRPRRGGRRCDEDAGAVGGVHLVAREGEQVEVAGVIVGPHVDGPVRDELRGVDGDARAVRRAARTAASWMGGR